MIPALVIVATLLHFFFSYKRPAWGLCSLLSIKILIPDSVRFPIGNLSLNTACGLILFVCWFIKGGIFQNQRVNRLSLFLMCFICFLASIMLVTADVVPVSAQFKPFFAYVVLQLLPIIVMIESVKTKEDVELLVKCFAISTTICVVYSVVCFVGGLTYPYNAMVNDVYPGRDMNIESVLEQEMGGIAGRCMGTATSGTWDYGMVVASLFLIVGSLAVILKSKPLYWLWVLTGVDVLCTTRRSPIIAAMFFLLIIFLFGGKNGFFKKILYVILGGGVISASVFIFPQLAEFRSIIETCLFFWDDGVAAMNDVSGSSLDFRLYQLKHTVMYVEDNPFFGNGWGSCFYNSRYPNMIGWESIVFTTLMQFGYVGSFLWLLLFCNFYIYSRKSGQRLVCFAFMAASLAFCVLNDTIYPFYIYFGAVLIPKLRLLHGKKSNVFCNKHVIY